MSDEFAGSLAARLHQCISEAGHTSPQPDASGPLAPLHIRLKKLLSDLPSDLQTQGLSLLDLQARLRGRKGGMPHIGELGAAMRRLGWKRRREWSNEETGFVAKWFPPAPS